jgi:hypothetical protein
MKKIMLYLVLVMTTLVPTVSYSSTESPQVISQQTFSMPRDAVKAVIHACEQNDIDGLLKIFGPRGKDIVESGDPTDDKNRRAHFTKLAHEKYKLIQDTTNPDKMIVSIGKQDWPFPIPLVRKDQGWYFDSSQGRQEILARRIGANEINAVEICRGYVEAQFEYAQSHRHNGVPEYAQKIVSSQGKQDGLYWEPSKEGPECQVPKGFAQAAASMSMEKREPYHGYYFRILMAQGPDARGGVIHYILDGSMIGGFALVAWPAEYGVSGVQTFIINHDGTVYENNLGPETGRVAAEMTEFNPDKTWRPFQLGPAH